MENQNSIPIGKAIEINEQKRTYFYPVTLDNGSPAIVEITLENVVELVVRDSGTHRLKIVKDGKKKLEIMPAGWLRIEVEAEEWTV